MQKNIAATLFSKRDLKRWADAGAALTPGTIARIDEALGNLAQHHPASAAHSERVGKTVARFARYLGIPDTAATALQQAGRLHDIGKSRVSAELMDTPGRLTKEQYREIQGHVKIGAGIVARMPDLVRPLRSLSVDAVMGHHEQFDGRGYPVGKSGPEISPVGRLLKIVDVYDALKNRGGYRKRLRPQATSRFMNSPSMIGQFDPALLFHFREMMEPKPSSNLGLRGRSKTQIASRTAPARNPKDAFRNHAGVRVAVALQRRTP